MTYDEHLPLYEREVFIVLLMLLVSRRIWISTVTIAISNRTVPAVRDHFAQVLFCHSVVSLAQVFDTATRFFDASIVDV